MATSGAGARAAQFLSQIGTAGGPVGAATAPGLVAYGAGELGAQLRAGNTDPYAAQRMGTAAPQIGSPSTHPFQPDIQGGSAAMPPNLDTGYVHLNIPGSPLPLQGLMGNYNLRAAQANQRQIKVMEQQMLNGAAPIRGQLPMLPIASAIGAAQQLSAQAAQQKGGR